VVSVVDPAVAALQPVAELWVAAAGAAAPAGTVELAKPAKPATASAAARTGRRGRDLVAPDRWPRRPRRGASSGGGTVLIEPI
jgi:hypothetical protein